MAERIMLLLVTVLLAPDLSSAISSQFYPSLQDNPSACWNRTEPMPYNLRICDPEKVVSSQQALDLHNLAESVKAETACPCASDVCFNSRLYRKPSGYSVTLALVKTMGSNFYISDTSANYALTLRQGRGFYDRGYTKCEEDILIFLSYNQRYVYVMTGNVVMAHLTNDEIADIIADANNSFSLSVADGLGYIIRRIKQELPPKQK